ncbi:branched-chain amino acid ABC transporter permease [Nocardioides litoris]|uniref:branched-chain amino acid ABC transporter permease n=1 Tax=Nocardioides litoris TaxID=1926648 RepID=UPI00112448F3|nr:branched-chain amino acid ABC transporter permease [Nocardioides litoris]
MTTMSSGLMGRSRLEVLEGRWRLVLFVVVAGFLLVAPFVLTPFFFVQILIRSLWLGTVAVSLTFLIRYAGMISLAQTGIYGVAAYVTANLSVTRGVEPWTSACAGITVAVVLAVMVGALAARARGVYFLMLTLAVGVFLYYFALQYRPFTFGFSGINGVAVPSLGSIQLSDPRNFYYAALVAAAVCLLGLSAYSRSPLGLALQADRDCPERARALGMEPLVVRVVGFAVAGVVAAIGGVLSVWFNGQVSPGSLDVTRTIDVLVIAVLGGVARLEGAWLGALLLSVLTVYVSDLTDYYTTVIGLVFIGVVLASPNGVPGAAASAISALRRLVPRAPAHGSVPPTQQEKPS